jgi:hypothetical protein
MFKETDKKIKDLEATVKGMDSSVLKAVSGSLSGLLKDTDEQYAAVMTSVALDTLGSALRSFPQATQDDIECKFSDLLGAIWQQGYTAYSDRHYNSPPERSEKRKESISDVMVLIFPPKK